MWNNLLCRLAVDNKPENQGRELMKKMAECLGWRHSRGVHNLVYRISAFCKQQALLRYTV